MSMNAEDDNLKTSIGDIINYIDKKPSSLIGCLCYYLFPYRKQTILNNMRLVFKDQLDNKRLKKLCCLFYKHLLTTLLDSFKLFFYRPKRIKRYGKIIGVHHALPYSKALFFTGHFGSWEFGTVACLVHTNKKVFFIRKPLKFKWLERFVYHNYRKYGIGIIRKNNQSLLKAYRRLENNQSIVFIMDQHASVPQGDGIIVEFFNQPSATYRSLATFAQKLHLPVIPTYLYKDDNGCHVLEIQKPLIWQTCPDKTQEIYRNTQIYNRCLENMLLRHPDQWLWSHKRWKGAV